MTALAISYLKWCTHLPTSNIRRQFNIIYKYIKKLQHTYFHVDLKKVI